MTSEFTDLYDHEGFQIWADETAIYIAFKNCTMAIEKSGLDVLIKGLLESRDKLEKLREGV